jgi:uncharacterized protein involved in exopolysaccharide biosynthesis
MGCRPATKRTQRKGCTDQCNHNLRDHIKVKRQPGCDQNRDKCRYHGQKEGHISYTTARVPHEFVVQDSFDAYQFLHYLRRRSRFILVVCVAAGTLALLVSLLLPKQFTATASIVIDPPAGTDPRNSLSVTPIYLESLRSYEIFASGNTLFQRALDKFHLRDPQSTVPLESLKSRVLKVTKIRDTNILEIAITLPDARQAQSLAQYLADETVTLNRNANRENDRDLISRAEEQFADAQKVLEEERKSWREFSSRNPVEVLRVEIEAQTTLLQRLQRDLADAKAEVAELTGHADESRLAGVRARAQSLEKQDSELQRQMDASTTLLSQRDARAEELQERLRAAQIANDAAAGRLRELRAATGLRGERLRVMDPGVVPERPTSPNIWLNVLLALAVSLAGCITYLALTFHPAES